MTVETFIQRLTAILAALAALVAARLLHHPTLARQIIPLWTYITHLPRRIERTLTHPPRPRPARTSREDPEPSDPADSEPEPPSDQPAPRPRWHLPTSKIWLIRVLGWEAACYASQLRCLLAEPGAQAILAACPTAQRRLLPLVHILIPAHWDNPFLARSAPTPPTPARPRRCPPPPKNLPDPRSANPCP